jgi:probable addiction module antidote protein
MLGFLAVLGDVARVRGIAQIAKETGLGRENLYKS